ncbi:MAG TPA: biotin--[acetyl-CoA-carboxylase] ligase [Candidatus Limnocylindrales bacterium]
MTGTGFVARHETFAAVGSTNDVVRDWLATGTPEVCIAVADEQTAGRGREDRRWLAPRGAGLLVSLGFRPTWLDPGESWRLAAAVSLAMADAAESVAGLEPGTIALKWPNDLVAVAAGRPLKLAGVLGETEGLGSDDPRAVVGIGVNVDWAAAGFPADLADAMTSLRELAGRGVERHLLLEAFVDRLGGQVDHLRAGRFDLETWVARQVTNERVLVIERPDRTVEQVVGKGVNPRTGALVVTDLDGRLQELLIAEIRHVRLAEADPSSFRFGIRV